MNKVPAYALMETEFEGFPTKEEIQPFMRQVLTMYETPETEESLNEFGAVLVVLKKNHNVPEMDILEHIIEAGDKGLSFKMQATISAVYLSKYKK